VFAIWFVTLSGLIASELDCFLDCMLLCSCFIHHYSPQQMVAITTHLKYEQTEKKRKKTHINKLTNTE